ncbi:MAG: S-layer protein domain-containing protein [Candidatus Methanogasteraceae archaeon]
MSRPVAVLVAAAALMAMVVAVVVCAGVGMAAGATTWDVYQGDGTPIQDAIDDAEPGDTIYVHAGTYVENLVVRKSLTLVGENRSTTVIDGDGSADIIRVRADGCTITGFTIVGADDCEWAEKTLATGEVWNIGGGFALTPKQIDVDGCMVWFSFTKDGKEYNNQVMSAGDAYTFIDYKNEDVPVILCYVVCVFRGAESNFVQIKYVLFGDLMSGADTGVFVEETTGLWPIAGIKLDYHDNNIVTDNEISLCNCGIRLQYFDNNVLTANAASDNNCGISLRGSSNDNTIYHNNLINNTNYNAYDEHTNQWDSGSAGNYHYNYTGTDNNTDGIGDTPYPIPGGGGSIDRFPLMQPWSDTPPQKGDLNGDGRITPADSAIVLQLAAGGSASCDPATFAAADVSDDNRVTSLDALMIMRLAAGAIVL